jgi:LysM domain
MFDRWLDTERVFGQYLRMSRTRVRWVRVVAVVVAAACLGAGGARLAGPSGAARPVAARIYVVRPGDTLWGIASRLDPAADPRAVVDRLAARNHVRDGVIAPGERLVVDP